MLRLIVLVWLTVYCCSTYQHNDIINTQFQVVHANKKTPWTELPTNQMPRFGSPNTHVIHFALPDAAEAIQPNNDVKLYDICFCTLILDVFMMIYIEYLHSLIQSSCHLIL